MEQTAESKKTVLIIMGRYLPGYKDGGPVRSVKNLTDFLGKEYNFKILTCDRDHGDVQPYADIKVNGWNHVGNADVYYVPPGGFKINLIKKLSRQADLIYVCGCFNDYAINTLIANRLGKIKIPVVVAAMGLFSLMQFRIKYKKKKLFTTVFNITGMFKNIYWSATSETEISEIKQQIKASDDRFFIAEDLPRRVDEAPIVKSKKPGKLDVVWISRIAPNKNLKTAVQILGRVKSEVFFTIYGSVQSEKYWNDCKAELAKLPANVRWKYSGAVESDRVIETLKKHQVFLFPTLSENYGHVIPEALSAGCPCIISDRTPWHDLEQNGIGYVIPLDERQKYVQAIEKYADMNEEDFNLCVSEAKQYAVNNSVKKSKTTGYRKIFDSIGNK